MIIIKWFIFWKLIKTLHFYFDGLNDFLFNFYCKNFSQSCWPSHTITKFYFIVKFLWVYQQHFLLWIFLRARKKNRQDRKFLKPIMKRQFKRNEMNVIIYYYMKKKKKNIKIEKFNEYLQTLIIIATFWVIIVVQVRGRAKRNLIFWRYYN